MPSPARGFAETLSSLQFTPSLCACAQESTKGRHILLMGGRCNVRVVKPETIALLCAILCRKHRKNGLSAGLFASTRHPLHVSAMATAEGRRGELWGQAELSHRRRSCCGQCCRLSVSCTHITHVLVMLNSKSTLESWKPCYQDFNLRQCRLGSQSCQPLLSLLFLSLSCSITSSFFKGCHITGESLIHQKWQPGVSAGIL